jgi:AbrB family looped-hinge helix DNA binding protein
MTQKALTTTLSTKGQVVLPKETRLRREWPAGTKLVVEERGVEVVLRPEKPFAATTIDEVYGSLRNYGVRVREEDIPAKLKAAAKRRYARD